MVMRVGRHLPRGTIKMVETIMGFLENGENYDVPIIIEEGCILFLEQTFLRRFWYI
jgi:hypothetical protein